MKSLGEMNAAIDVNNLTRVCFLGIGGIGMSALARYFNARGVAVSGYDRMETALTRQLVSEGIAVHYDDDTKFIDQGAELVVYTPAIPEGHKELNYYRGHEYVVVKRSEVLGAITKGSFSICIAGTHGKTTTSTMVAHILRQSGYGCSAFLGGISVNYNSNFWLQEPGPDKEKKICVVEADEYDRSFLKLEPDVAVITAMDPDHLDIYGTAWQVEEAFIEFSARVKKGGLLLSKFGLPRNAELLATAHLTYHLEDEDADYHASGIQAEAGSYRFSVVGKGSAGANWKLDDVVLNMGGMHNIENVTAAVAIAHHLGIDDEKIKKAVFGFRGVKRRFEYVVKNERRVYIDDYAHHPEELKALISGAKSLFAGKKCTVVFQPHLYSRTRDFAAGFAESLDEADEVILLPVYPARELPISGVNSEMILSRMNNKNKTVMTKEELLNRVGAERPELLITAGAGDIDSLVEPLRMILE
jgi:UDP-N-acetylmuramate--alanine ligase